MSIKLDKLEQLNDKILLAADVYIESHPEVKKAVNDTKRKTKHDTQYFFSSLLKCRYKKGLV